MFARLATAAAVLAASLTSLADVSATVVAPYDFRQLVAESTLIFTGEVIRTESRWTDSDGGRSIVTAVTFRIDRVLKGAAPGEVTLEFLGGRVGDVALNVEGTPRFVIGDRAVMCVDTTSRLVSPIVGFNQGRFPIHRQPETGQEYVTTFDGAAFPAVQSLGQPRIVTSERPVRTLTREELELEILREASAARP
jgi:hypothetical protein